MRQWLIFVYNPIGLPISSSNLVTITEDIEVAKSYDSRGYTVIETCGTIGLQVHFIKE